MPESWKICVCILVQKKDRGRIKNEYIIEENQTRVFPEGLILRGQRRAVTEPAPEKPGCVWDGPTGCEREREKRDLPGESSWAVSNTPNMSGEEKLCTSLLKQSLYTKKEKSSGDRQTLPCFGNLGAHRLLRGVIARRDADQCCSTEAGRLAADRWTDGNCKRSLQKSHSRCLKQGTMKLRLKTSDEGSCLIQLTSSRESASVLLRTFLQTSLSH